MPGSGPTAASYDPEAVRAKYLAERDKRLVPGRADIRDLRTDEHFARYRDDPFTPGHRARAGRGRGRCGDRRWRDRRASSPAPQLRKAGIERIRIIDQAGGIGGTWYWNRYPGVMCDVESYIYMPMLEELDYIPTRRYAFGEEIRQSPRGDRRAVRPHGRRPLPHRGDPRRVGRGQRPGGGSAPTAATRSAAAGTCWPSGSSTS